MKILMMNSIQFDFLKSALTKKDISSTIAWIKEQNKAVNVSINKVNFEKLEKWHFDIKEGNLRHDTGKFFSIDGIRVNTTWGRVLQWYQPIINQP